MRGWVAMPHISCFTKCDSVGWSSVVKKNHLCQSQMVLLVELMCPARWPSFSEHFLVPTTCQQMVLHADRVCVGPAKGICFLGPPPSLPPALVKRHGDLPCLVGFYIMLRPSVCFYSLFFLTSYSNYSYLLF